MVLHEVLGHVYTEDGEFGAEGLPLGHLRQAAWLGGDGGAVVEWQLPVILAAVGLPVHLGDLQQQVAAGERAA